MATARCAKIENGTDRSDLSKIGGAKTRSFQKYRVGVPRYIGDPVAESFSVTRKEGKVIMRSFIGRRPEPKSEEQLQNRHWIGNRVFYWVVAILVLVARNRGEDFEANWSASLEESKFFQIFLSDSQEAC